MGMFDSFYLEDLKCPKCNDLIDEVQTKQFSCCLRSWRLGGIFEEFGELNGTSRTTVSVNCYSDNCSWSGVLEVTITNNVITEMKGIDFGYHKMVDVKDHLRAIVRERDQLKEKVDELSSGIAQLLAYLYRKDPSQKEKYTRLQKELIGSVGGDFDSLFKSFKFLPHQYPVLISLMKEEEKKDE